MPLEFLLDLNAHILLPDLAVILTASPSLVATRIAERRGGPYGYGRWHMPSGKLDRDESLSSGAVRELMEEAGVAVDPDHLRMVHVVHHQQSDTVERIGFFFEATQWTDEPVNREPAKCLGLEWFSVHELPEDIIEYPKEGLLG